MVARGTGGAELSTASLNRKATNPKSAAVEISCPLCGEKEFRIRRKLELSDIVSRWRDAYSIDISVEFEGYAYSILRECKKCRLEYFSPPLAGSGQMYSQLQRFPWYYMSEKWEYSVAMDDLDDERKVVEIGCGRGEFLDRLSEERGADAMGIELNPSAVHDGKKLGRNVSQITVRMLADANPEAFDAVCSFQVLEHVPDIRAFLESCVRLLKPGGYLLLGVPNNDSYIRHATPGVDLLNQPPHHVSRWSKRVFEYFPKILPVRIVKVLEEPLASYHVTSYFHVQATRFLRSARLSVIVGKLFAHTLIPLIAATEWNKYIRGHSMYVKFVRVPE